jgi:hypothetical protein
MSSFFETTIPANYIRTVTKPPNHYFESKYEVLGPKSQQVNTHDSIAHSGKWMENGVLSEEVDVTLGDEI